MLQGVHYLERGTMSDTTFYPIWERASRANPQAIYEQMREKDPIWRGVGPVTGNHFWFFVRYEDVQAVLKDQRFVKDAANLPPEHAKKYIPENPNPMFDAINRNMLFLDAPDHTRLRGLVHKAFTPKRIRDLEPRIEAIAHELLDAMASKADGNLIEDFAFPLPVTVIAEMLGVHKERRDDFRRWTRMILFNMDEASSLANVMEFVQYMNELIEVRRNQETDDILGALVRVQEGEDALDHMELLAMIFLLLVAGHETTVNLIGNGTLSLLQNPEQMTLLKNELSLMPKAIEELLRYNGPVETTTTRWASEDIELSGCVIPAGDFVLPSLLAANRDPDVFKNPNQLDITRDPNPHIAFGHGIHYCLGAPLARLEGQIAMKALLQRFPTLRLNAPVESLQWSENLLLHGLMGLPVAW
jgi:cytochrome P450